MCTNFCTSNGIDDHWHGASSFASVIWWICASTKKKKTVLSDKTTTRKRAKKPKTKRNIHTDQLLSHHEDLQSLSLKMFHHTHRLLTWAECAKNPLHKTNWNDYLCTTGIPISVPNEKKRTIKCIKTHTHNSWANHLHHRPPKCFRVAIFAYQIDQKYPQKWDRQNNIVRLL